MGKKYLVDVNLGFNIYLNLKFDFLKNIWNNLKNGSRKIHIFLFKNPTLYFYLNLNDSFYSFEAMSKGIYMKI